MITFNCPECNRLTKAKDREAGSYVRCDTCNEPVWVPVDENEFTKSKSGKAEKRTGLDHVVTLLGIIAFLMVVGLFLATRKAIIWVS